MWWELGAVANGVLFLAYIFITVSILVPLIASEQLRSNKLGAATAAIFFSCGIGHFFHFFHLIAPAIGLETQVGNAARASVEWHIVFWDSLTAMIGLYYVSLRKTYGSLMKGAALFDDMKEKQRQALEIHDNIVQGLVIAETALALDEHEVSQQALESTLAAARQIISGLLGEVGSEQRLGPGDLRRTKAAGIEAR
jgi:signal transduction histidine kinase